MKVAAFFLIFLTVLLAGCGGSANSNANVDTTAVAEYTDAKLALADGIRLLDTGETDQAIAVLNQAVKLDPDLADAYFQLGVAYALVEKRDAGEMTTSEPDSKDSKSNSEVAFEKAVEGYKKLTAANKEDHAAFFNLGRSYNKLNKDVDAERAFEQAVKLNPEDSEYQTEYGSILIKLARYREAIGPLKKALEIDPENIEAQELLEDAEAGRRRVDYTSTPKKDANSNTNTSNSNSNTSAPPSNTGKPPDTPKPVPTKQPTNRP